METQSHSQEEIIHLQPADIILVRGDSIISKIIRWGTRHLGEKRTKVNHAAMMTGFGVIAPSRANGIFIEAARKVWLQDLSVYRLKRNDQIAIYRCKDLTPEERTQIVSAAMDHYGEKYGFIRIIAAFGDYCLLGAYFFRRMVKQNKYPICSWIVAHAYGRVEKNLGAPIGMATPDDIWDYVEENSHTHYDCIFPLQSIRVKGKKKMKRTLEVIK
ncbi:MAG: hypothetical protein WC291_11350 [Thermodesulfovibrionales bacterium]|jgi:hypothetical protein